MLTIHDIGFDTIYYKLYKEIETTGTPYGPRGKTCVEVRPACIEIISPDMALYTGKSRRLNYAFWAAETMCYIAGTIGGQHARIINAFNPNMKFALNDAGTYDGAYGIAFRSGLQRVYDELHKDIDSRRGVISIWSHVQEMTSKDIPCTVSMHFFNDKSVDGDMLSASVYMRSNDLNWGTPYDIAAFCAIQCMMASCLGVHNGVYYHNVGSLHYYEHGNSEGEGPPKLVATDEETWLLHDNVFIPVPKPGIPFIELINVMRTSIDNLYMHIHREQPMSTFDIGDSYRHPGLYEYMKHWESLLKWTWKKDGGN